MIIDVNDYILNLLVMDITGSWQNNSIHLRQIM